MALLELSVVPLGVGQSVGAQVAECVELIDRSGLPYELHAMGTVVEGELHELLAIVQQCMEQMAKHSDRVTCQAKFDYHKGKTGRLRGKVESVERRLGKAPPNAPHGPTA